MSTDSLKSKCVITVAHLLMNFDWLDAKLNDNGNIFSCFPSQIIEQLFSAAVKLSARRGLRYQQLCPLLKSGRIQNFELCDIRIDTCEFVSILDCLGNYGDVIVKLVFCRVHCIKSDRAKLLQSEAVERLLRSVPNLEHLYLDIPIDIDVLKYITNLRWLELHFFPRTGDLNSLIPQSRQSNSNLQHVAIYEGSQYTIPVEMIAFLLQNTPELLCLENSIAGALELLHGNELDAGIINKRYKLCRIILGNSFLEPDRSPASQRVVKIAAITCPNLSELDLIANTHEAVLAVCQMKQLHTLIIQWADVIPAGNFQKGYLALLQILGQQLQSLGIIFFSNIDFGMIVSLCPNLVNLKVIFETEVKKCVPHNTNLVNLQTLHLECMTSTGPSADVLVLLISKCINIKVLFLVHVPHLTDNVLHRIFAKNNTRKLQDVTIVDCNLSLDGLQWFLKSCPALETMRFRSSLICLEEAIPIIQSLNTKEEEETWKHLHLVQQVLMMKVRVLINVVGQCINYEDPNKTTAIIYRKAPRTVCVEPSSNDGSCLIWIFIEENDGTSNNDVLQITLSIIGAFIGILLIWLICFKAIKCVKERRKKHSVVTQNMWISEIDNSVLSYTNRTVNEIYEDELDDYSRRIHISNLEKYVLERRNNDSLKKEFELVNKGPYHPCTVAEYKENERKNRYAYILPYDHTRVILEKLPNDPFSDYINASYIKGYTHSKKYIATQGPKPLRMVDFWRMVWQEGACKIIMVTNLLERGETKCKRYWPKKTEHYGNVKVQLVDQDVSADFVIRTFFLTKNNETRQIKQFHFTAWPEKKTPWYPSSLLKFVGNIRDYKPQHAAPIIVHSSAGIGRTGAFILFDYMLDMMLLEEHVDLLKCLWNMREQRMNMVETAEQYVFIYEALLDALWPFNTSIHCYKFNTQFEEMKQVDQSTGNSYLKNEFKQLNQLCCPSLSTSDSKSEEKFTTFKDMEKDEQDHIISFGMEKDSNFEIHFPLYVEGYRRHKAFIVTKIPDSTQAIEFWKFIYETKTQTIVLLNDLDSICQYQTVTRYWPREGIKVNFGEFILEYISKESDDDDIVIRSFKLISNESKSNEEKIPSRVVKQFNFIKWKAMESVPSSAALFSNLINKVEKWQLETPKHSVIVQCLDGIRCSGIFCTCYFICKKIELEKEVDVYLAAKSVRHSTSQFVENLEQYIFCYAVAGTFLKQFCNYANFCDQEFSTGASDS